MDAANVEEKLLQKTKGAPVMSPEAEYIGQRFASVEKKLDTMDDKLDSMRDEYLSQRKECAGEISHVNDEVKRVETAHGERLARHTSELLVWRWGLGMTIGVILLGLMNFAVHAIEVSTAHAMAAQQPYAYTYTQSQTQPPMQQPHAVNNPVSKTP